MHAVTRRGPNHLDILYAMTPYCVCPPVKKPWIATGATKSSNRPFISGRPCEFRTLTADGMHNVGEGDLTALRVPWVVRRGTLSFRWYGTGAGSCASACVTRERGGLCVSRGTEILDLRYAARVASDVVPVRRAICMDPRC